MTLVLGFLAIVPSSSRRSTYSVNILLQYVVFVKDIMMLAGQEKMEVWLITLAFLFLFGVFRDREWEYKES
jgi:hypothetical protein